MGLKQNTLIYKLQTALNQVADMKIMYNKSQFYGKDRHSGGNKTITMHQVKQAVWDEQKGKYVYQELFKSASQLQVILFLKDLWDEYNGRELDMSNEKWNTIRQRIREENENG